MNKWAGLTAKKEIISSLNITPSNEGNLSIGVWGQRRLKYVKTHHKVLYCNLLKSGKLYEHLAEIDTSTCNIAEYLIKVLQEHIIPLR